MKEVCVGAQEVGAGDSHRRSGGEQATEATHYLQGMTFVPLDIRVQCDANQDWAALESSIMGVKVGRGAAATTTSSDPISP
jgi:hypothetical protein